MNVAAIIAEENAYLKCREGVGERPEPEASGRCFYPP
jgi:hypothetical protein